MEKEGESKGATGVEKDGPKASSRPPRGAAAGSSSTSVGGVVVSQASRSVDNASVEGGASRALSDMRNVKFGSVSEVTPLQSAGRGRQPSFGERFLSQLDNNLDRARRGGSFGSQSLSARINELMSDGGDVEDIGTTEPVIPTTASNADIHLERGRDAVLTIFGVTCFVLLAVTVVVIAGITA